MVKTAFIQGGVAAGIKALGVAGVKITFEAVKAFTALAGNLLQTAGTAVCGKPGDGPFEATLVVSNLLVGESLKGNLFQKF